jgi:trigger factor
MTNIVVEDLGPVKKRVTFEVPREKYLDVVDTEYRNLKKNVQLKGFRKGKVPMDMVRAYFRTQVESDAANKLIEETFKPSLDKENLELVSVLKLEPKGVEDDKPFTYLAEIEVAPAIDPHDYFGLMLAKKVREADDAAIDARLNYMRELQSHLEPLTEDRALRKEDVVQADIDFKVDGEPVPSLTVEDYHLEIGRDFFLPGFDAHLEGMKPDETKRFSFTLPESFPNAELAGKTGEAEVKILGAKEFVVPPLDDDFAKDTGQYETLAHMREEIGKMIQRDLDAETEKSLQVQAVDLLLEAHPFDVPESLVESRLDAMIREQQEMLLGGRVPAEKIPPPSDAMRERTRPFAIKSVKSGYIVEAIAKKENVEVAEEDLNAALKERAELFGWTPDYLKSRLEEADRLEDLKLQIRNDKTIKMIVEKAEITEEQAPAAEQVPDSATTEPSKEE